MQIAPLLAISIAIEEEYKMKSALTQLKFEQGIFNAMINTKFILIELETGKFYVSMNLNNTLQDASQYTKFLLTLLEDRLAFYPDNCIDLTTGEFFFGKTAYEKANEWKLEEQGVKVCPCCDLIQPLQLFRSKSGICVVCEKEVLPNSTIH